ncbi:hypothetical protein GGQ68_003611 [Sagittula marina]|uniref:Uncharacterized protein n=1 Tax=Sagittula marina TaxID=943940 RepID=A0A7W6DQC7_9RHOB|nr:hypothetical protein [Sagittula marina]
MQISPLLQRLVAGGPVTVKPYECDRRERLAGMVDKGWDILRRTLMVVENTNPRVFESLYRRPKP